MNIATTNHDAVLQRIQEATGLRTQVELAEVLGIRQSSISDAKRRGQVPAAWLVSLMDRFGLNPLWLRDGQGPRRFDAANGWKPLNDADQAPIRRSDDKPGHFTARVRNTLGEDEDQILTLPEKLWMPGLSIYRQDAEDMSPLIRRGALVGVDRENMSAAGGTIQAFYVDPCGLCFRSLYQDINGKLSYILRAQSGPDWTWSRQELDDRLWGRVAWVVQDL